MMEKKETQIGLSCLSCSYIMERDVRGTVSFLLGDCVSGSV